MEVESQKRTNSNSLKAIMPHCTQILHPCITWTLFSLFLIALVLRVWVQILSCPCIFFCSVNSLQFRLARNTAIKMVFVFLANSPNGVDVTVVWNDRCRHAVWEKTCAVLSSKVFCFRNWWMKRITGEPANPSVFSRKVAVEMMFVCFGNSADDAAVVSDNRCWRRWLQRWWWWWW